MSDPASSNGEVTPWQCLIAGGFGFLLYQLTTSIAATFATKPLAQKSYLAANIGVAVRTLVVGACSLGTFIFILGLLALGIQTLVRQTNTKT